MRQVMLAINFVVSRRENHNNTVRPAWPVTRCQANPSTATPGVRLQRTLFVSLQHPQPRG
jgi:hypothetical protein